MKYLDIRNQKIIDAVIEKAIRVLPGKPCPNWNIWFFCNRGFS